MMPPRLGRGLAALIGDPPPTAPGEPGGPRQIPVEFLAPGPFQPRGPIHPDSITELVQSVRARGILQPLLVRPDPNAPGRFQIIAGERRWRAARKAGLAMVPVVIKEVPDDRLLEIALVENIQRQELNPIEEATAYWQLGEHLRLTQEQVADRVGKSRPQVANTLRLLRLPAELKAEVATGKLSTGHAKVLLGVSDPRLQEQLAFEVVDQQLSVRALEARIQQLQKQTKTKGKKKHPQELFIKAAAEELTQSWGTKVEIKAKGKSGSVVLHFGSDAELDRLFEALKHGPAKRR